MPTDSKITISYRECDYNPKAHLQSEMHVTNITEGSQLRLSSAQSNSACLQS